MKKILSVICAVFIVLLGVVGCKSPTPTEPSSFQVPTVFEYYPTGESIAAFTCDVGDYSETEELFIMELKDNGLGSYRLYDASELDADILENRNGITIIERCIGFVENADTGDGIILNGGGYISYRSCGQEIRDGTILASYMVYNPDNNYVDDIIERYDFVICRDYEYDSEVNKL